ncbi:MAG: toprim domain-containing protein, partial [Streptococcus mitis]|nr:toprim domain-containing protein [Streptococcus mitis]
MALSKEEAKRLSIISVAEQLGIELKRTGSYSYTWTEHDSFVIDTKKNEFHWNSRTEFGDVIQLVQTIRGVSYKEAMHFLETGEFKEVDLEAQTASKELFSYHLERYERQDFSASRRYLKAQRGLSDDTINFFISQGSIAEAIRKKGDYFEPVIVFKYKDNIGFLAGASLQGIVENREHYPERGRLKQIMRNSDGQLGFSIDIGNPKRLVFAEAPIDLMSYYELHKDRLQDVRLIAMDGVKEGIISRRFMELYAETNDKSYQVNQNTGKALEVVARTTNYFKDGQHQDMITLAVDNDMAGHKFITSLQEKGIPVQIAIPPIFQRGQEKEDWNDFLKGGNNTPKELAHVYTADEKSWHYQGFFEKELALAKAQELTTDDVKAFVSDRQLTREEVHQEYQTIINQERGRKNSMSKLHENSSDHEDDLVNNPQQADRIPVQPETQAIIDSGEVKQWAKHPHIYFVKGLRQVALELTEEGKFEQSSQYLPNTDEEKEVVNKLLSKQKKQDEVVLEDDQSSVLNIDTSNLSPEDAEWLKQNWHNINFSVEPKKQMFIDSDKTVTFEKPSDPVGDTYKAQEENQS